MPCGAVFLSYASQDAEAARRLCESLRQAGVEVWFDQSELRGGDAWDAKIRKQIKECALFVPMISANTQARREGYFRLEWKLADDRTHLMAKGTPFLLPVCVDDTKDWDAIVPDSFMAVQWTRIAGRAGVGPFCGRVRTLVDPAIATPPISEKSNREGTSSATRGGQVRTSRRRGPWLAFGLVAVAIAVGVGVWQKARSVTPAPASNSPVAGDASVAESVAVLPFANLSGDPAQEYFSDGVAEEIRNALARERGLRVPGRSSSFSFKGRNVPATEIARALSVARLVEGSVRKAGSRVRINVSLTRGSDGFSEELGSFDEELTDIFALQDKVARAIAEKLIWRAPIARAPVLTKSPEAYDAYLRGRALQTRAAGFRYEAAAEYERAVAADPQFALAWARLAEARFRDYRAFFDWRPAIVEATRTAIDRALAARPDLPEALIVRAEWQRLVTCDYAAAQRDLDRAETLQPASSELRHAQGLLALDRGDKALAKRHLRAAMQIDPENGDRANSIGNTFNSLGELQTADDLYARAMRIQGPGQLIPVLNRVDLRARWRGPEAALRFLDRVPAGQRGLEELVTDLLLQLGRDAEATGHARRIPIDQFAAGDFVIFQDAEFVAHLLALTGDTDRARGLWQRLREAAAQEVSAGDLAPRVRKTLIRAEAALGHREAAQAALTDWKKSAASIPSAIRRVTEFSRQAVVCYADLGMKDEAIALLEEIENSPLGYGFSLRGFPEFRPLRGDPRFDELVRRAEDKARAQPDPLDP